MNSVGDGMLVLLTVACLLGATLADPVAATGWVESEPNDDFSSAGIMYVGDTVSAQMSDYDQDFYAVEVTDLESIIVETKVGTGADVHIAVYDPSMNQIKQWIQAQGSEGAVTVATSNDGTYYVQVYSSQYANLVTNYTIGVSGVPYETN